MARRWILLLLLAFVLAIGTMTTGVWAQFADPETSSGSLTSAGTLDLSPTVSGGGPAGKYVITPGGNFTNGNVVFSNITPGNSGSEEWTMTNLGTVQANLTVASTVTFANGSGPAEIRNAVANPHSDNAGSGLYTAAGDLDEFMGVTLQVGVGADKATADTAAASNYVLGDATNYVPMAGLQTAFNDVLKTREPMQANGANDTVVYILKWSLASPLKGSGADGKFGTGDDVAADTQIIEGDSAAINITFTLLQP